METIMQKIKYMFEGHSIIKLSYFMNLSFCLWAFLALFFIGVFNCKGGLICACLALCLICNCYASLHFFEASITWGISFLGSYIVCFIIVLNYRDWSICNRTSMFFFGHSIDLGLGGTLNVKFGIYVHQTTIFWEDIR
jgi:hypothetical protein